METSRLISAVMANTIRISAGGQSTHGPPRPMPAVLLLVRPHMLRIFGLTRLRWRRGTGGGAPALVHCAPALRAAHARPVSEAATGLLNATGLPMQSASSRRTCRLAARAKWPAASLASSLLLCGCARRGGRRRSSLGYGCSYDTAAGWGCVNVWVNFHPPHGRIYASCRPPACQSLIGMCTL